MMCNLRMAQITGRVSRKSSLRHHCWAYMAVTRDSVRRDDDCVTCFVHWQTLESVSTCKGNGNMPSFESTSDGSVTKFADS